jgi:hypothetical protein
MKIEISLHIFFHMPVHKSWTRLAGNKEGIFCKHDEHTALPLKSWVWTVEEQKIQDWLCKCRAFRLGLKGMRMPLDSLGLFDMGASVCLRRKWFIKYDLLSSMYAYHMLFSMSKSQKRRGEFGEFDRLFWHIRKLNFSVHKGNQRFRLNWEYAFKATSAKAVPSWRSRVFFIQA